MIFQDRRHAGRLLGERLVGLREKDPIILGLPRGGVPVADEVARALGAPLDVIVVRKLGVPYQPELGMGAVGEDGVRVLNHQLIELAEVSEPELQLVISRERAAVEERAKRYRADSRALPLTGRTVIIVDDGIATGGTARAAVQVARARGAGSVIVAVPVAAPDSVRELKLVADDVIALETPRHLVAVGGWYHTFGQTSDDEVMRILAAAAHPPVVDDRQAPSSGTDLDVIVPAGETQLGGRLTVPSGSIGLVLFAHGSGSSRHSPRNRSVAAALNEARIGTLLFDLLTQHEATDRRLVFDIPFLAARLEAATSWLARRPEVHGVPLGYFGASTGAGAALWAAAAPDSPVVAVVSRGGRPDLAIPRLGAVRAPTLLIVGGHDEAVLDLNREAARHLRCPHRISVVPGATHLFEEPGTLAAAAHLARDWFSEHFAAPGRVDGDESAPHRT
jgi:putative phosphoribosyl transferase